MQNIDSPQHDYFLKAADDGSLLVTIHRKLATRLMQSNLMPDVYRNAYKLRTWLWMALLPGALGVGYLVSWWLAPLLFVAMLFGRARSLADFAARYVLDYAKESELFYDIVVQLGIMTVREQPQLA